MLLFFEYISTLQAQTVSYVRDAMVPVIVLYGMAKRVLEFVA